MDDFDSIVKDLDLSPCSEDEVYVFDERVPDKELALKHWEILQDLHRRRATHIRNPTDPQVAELQSQLAACREEMRRRWTTP